MCKVHNQLELELTVKKIPPQIILETPFCIQCELVNCSERIIAPKLSFLRNKMTGVLVNGLSGQVFVNKCFPSNKTANCVANSSWWVGYARFVSVSIETWSTKNHGNQDHG